MTFDQELQSLQGTCQKWLEAYTQLEDKSNCIVAYKQYYVLEKFCTSYFESKEKNEIPNLEVLRQKHHYWQTRFGKSNFLAETQQVELVKEAYQGLRDLDQKMASIDWERHDLSSTQLDQQFHLEIQQWKAACHNWLLKQDNQFLMVEKASKLALQFLDDLKELREHIGQLS